MEETLNNTADMTGRVCLITGANNGIGKEAAVALAGMGATVVMVSRDRARGEAALADVRERSGADAAVDLMQADLASLASVRKLAAEFTARHRSLHVLLNNAGAYYATRQTTEDGHEMSIGVNHLAHFLLTNLLLETLKACAPARVINVSSGAHMRATIDFDDLHGERSYAGFGAYGQSKLANVLFTNELARRLEGTGVTANSLHPGVVRTGFGSNSAGVTRLFFRALHLVGRPFMVDAKQGAETSVYLASASDVETTTGMYFVKCDIAPANAIANDAAVAARLWEVSERLTS